jgi:hypothetical protein
VPGREFSRCTGLAALEEVAATADGVLLLLDPPHALRASATSVPPMASKVLHGPASLAPLILDASTF